MQVVDIDAARTNLSRLVDDAASGDEIIIARAGKPIARLVALAPAKAQRVLGQHDGRLLIPDDFDTMSAADVQALFEES